MKQSETASYAVIRHHHMLNLSSSIMLDECIFCCVVLYSKTSEDSLPPSNSALFFQFCGGVVYS